MSKTIYDNIRVTIHDEGYDGVWVVKVGSESFKDNYLFVEPDIKFSSKVWRATETKPFRYRLTLVEDFDE